MEGNVNLKLCALQSERGRERLKEGGKEREERRTREKARD